MSVSNDLESRVEAMLNAWVDETLGLSLGEMAAVKGVALEGARLAVALSFSQPISEGLSNAIVEPIRDALLAWPELDAVVIDCEGRVQTHRVQGELSPLSGVRNVIAVASAKGGVGKSTVAANLALALAADGARVGMLDADIYGPSQPRMLGIEGKPKSKDNKSIEPMENHGLQVMSIGFLVDTQTPMIWRGPMVSSALTQMLNDTNWRDLDYLVVDLPPGTGDIQLTMAQKIPVSGALVVSTPQEIALMDAVRGYRMFEKVGVPVLGLVENMAMHVCSQCGHQEAIFGEGGGARMAEDLGAELLASLPLDRAIRQQADAGQPSVVAEPHGKPGQAYQMLARRVAARLAIQPTNRKVNMPRVVISD
jgi:ATP-binding protein involved in chromosome partitioning